MLQPIAGSYASYMCYLLNHIFCVALDDKIPLFVLTGITPDISIILLFTFYQPVFYATYDQNFPSESEERAGYWVGFGEHCGDAITHKLLDHETQKSIYTSAVRPKNLLLPTICLHHMEGKFLHLLTLLKIKLPLDHHWDTQKVTDETKNPYSLHQVKR